MHKIVALVALACTGGSASAQQAQCRYIMIGDVTPVPIVDLAPGGQAAISVCIAAPDTGTIAIRVDGVLKMERRGKGNCGTVSGRVIALSAPVTPNVTVSYCLEAITLRPQ